LCYGVGVHCVVETYLTISEEERPAYEQRLAQGGHMAIKELEMTWGERLREEGRQEGREKWRDEVLQQGLKAGLQAGALAAKRQMLLDVLRIRFGEVPETLAGTIAQA
jgi:hypothetical protein